MKAGAVVLGGLLLAACSHAVRPPPVPQPELQSEALDPSVTMYLESKAQELGENGAMLRMLGIAHEVEALQELIRRRQAFEDVPVVGGTPAQRAEVVEVLETTAAQYLASVGITLAEATAAEEVGVDVAASAARVVSGGARFNDLVAVSEFVVLGTASGQECVIFLSRSLARFRSARRGDAGPVDGVVQQCSPYCLRDGLYASTGHHQQERVSATEVSSALEDKKRASAVR